MPENSKMRHVPPAGNGHGQARNDLASELLMFRKYAARNGEWERKMKHLNPCWRPSRNGFEEFE